MSSTMTTETEMESVEDFRARLRAWLADNVQRATRGARTGVNALLSDDAELALVQHSRDLQRQFFDAGFAGICVPKAYGGAGLTPEHADVLNEEIVGYEFPSRYQVPTM